MDFNVFGVLLRNCLVTILFFKLTKSSNSTNADQNYFLINVVSVNRSRLYILYPMYETFSFPIKFIII